MLCVRLVNLSHRGKARIPLYVLQATDSGVLVANNRCQLNLGVETDQKACARKMQNALKEFKDSLMIATAPECPELKVRMTLFILLMPFLGAREKLQNGQSQRNATHPSAYAESGTCCAPKLPCLCMSWVGWRAQRGAA